MAGSTLLAFVEDVVNIGAGCTRVTVGVLPSFPLLLFRINLQRIFRLSRRCILVTGG